MVPSSTTQSSARETEPRNLRGAAPSTTPSLPPRVSRPRHQSVRDSIESAASIITAISGQLFTTTALSSSTASSTTSSPSAEINLTPNQRGILSLPDRAAEKRAFLASIARFLRVQNLCGVLVQNQRRIDIETSEIVPLKGGDDFTSRSSWSTDRQSWLSLAVLAEPRISKNPPTPGSAASEDRSVLPLQPGKLVLGHRTWSSLYVYDGPFGSYETGGQRDQPPNGAGKTIYDKPLVLRADSRRDERWMSGVEAVRD